MERLTTTPFGQRPVTAALIEHVQAAMERPSIPHINKWELFRNLCTGRAAFGVSDRDLTVLNALLSFHQDANLSDNDNLIVFPSNAALSERAHGMAESTLRRHLAALVGAGLILRHDSPNGKRYAARGAGGEVVRAFGFDLRPLLVRAAEINNAAAEARAAADRLKRCREAITLLRRDALKLVQYGRESGFDGPWEGFEAALLDIHRQMRRKLPLEQIETIKNDLENLLARIRRNFEKTEKMGGNDVNIERHFHNSKPDSHESELCQEKAKGDDGGHTKTPTNHDPAKSGQTEGAGEPNIPLALVLKACPDILPYATGPVRHWHDLVSLAQFVRGMMGISPDAWTDAQRIMGTEIAAVTVAGILQRVDEIRSPGGYLRALTRKAEEGRFSPGPMIMALLRPTTAVA